MKSHLRFVLATAIFCGIFLSFSFVNPYGGQISLSELILQLSGSRGEFPLGLSLAELVSFSMRMIPSYIFEAYWGTELYRQFCTASVYVFSRHPNRLRWYFKEIFSIINLVFFFQIVLILSAIVTTIFRYDVQIDNSGAVLFVYHIMIHSAWIYCMTLCANLIAIYVGSSSAFLIVVGIQTILITLLNLIESELHSISIALNPISCLVLGWQTSSITPPTPVFNSPYASRLDISLSIMVVFSFFTTIVGLLLIKRHDLLVADLEIGGI